MFFIVKHGGYFKVQSIKPTIQSNHIILPLKLVSKITKHYGGEMLSETSMKSSSSEISTSSGEKLEVFEGWCVTAFVCGCTWFCSSSCRGSIDVHQRRTYLHQRLLKELVERKNATYPKKGSPRLSFF